MVCFSFSVHISVIFPWVILSTALFFSSFFFSIFFSTGRTAGKQSNMFQHGLMIRYPHWKKIFPCFLRNDLIISSLLWVDGYDETFRRTLERPLYLIIDSIRVRVLCYEFFFYFMRLLIFCFLVLVITFLALGLRLRFDEMKITRKFSTNYTYYLTLRLVFKVPSSVVQSIVKTG